MAGLQNEILAFDRMRVELEAEHNLRWVLFHGGQFIDVYPDFEAAATAAEERFADGSCLIRQVGAEAIQLSGGMVFRPKHVLDTRGL